VSGQGRVRLTIVARAGGALVHTGGEAVKQQCLAASVLHNTARTRPCAIQPLKVGGPPTKDIGQSTYEAATERPAARYDKLTRNYFCATCLAAAAVYGRWSN
jgi:hypothetical protein